MLDAAFRPDGRFLVSCGQDGNAIVWASVVRTEQNNKSTMKRLVTGGVSDGYCYGLALMDVGRPDEAERELIAHRRHIRSVLDAVFRPDGRYLASCAQNGDAVRWNSAPTVGR